MNVKEFYETIGESYDEVLETLGRDALIEKYLKRLTTEDVIDVMRAALEAKDWNGVFMSAHNLKGYALNLGLSKLSDVSSDLCESTRGGVSKGGEEELFAKVTEVFDFIIGNINKMNE